MFTNLIRSKKTPPMTTAQHRDEVLRTVNEESRITPSVAMPTFDPNHSFGVGVNLVAIVQEHTPKRIAEIGRMMAEHEKKMQILTHERNRLVAMITALEKIEA
jgi:DNA-binding IclR family transcriptional regulator